MRNTLTLIAAGSLTVLALTPALADGLCADHPRLDTCANAGAYVSPARPAAYKVAPSNNAHIQHPRAYPHHG